MNEYLESSVYIDWRHPDVVAKAAELAAGCESQHMVVNRCFEFLRDSIKHSGDQEVMTNLPDVEDEGRVGSPSSLCRAE
jgi:hypothetical protein